MKIRIVVSSLIVACALGATAAAPIAAEEAAAKPVEEAAVATPEPNPALLLPAEATEKAPDQFRVKMNTTKGAFVLEITRAWSPNGADRFYNLVKLGFFEEIAFFRVIPNFMAQFGIHGNPAVSRAWQKATIQDDPVVESNKRGYITFAKTGQPNSRATQFFINFRDNKNLDRMGFSPFGKVIEGQEVVDSIYKVGEGKPRGPGPHQGQVQAQGNAYLKQAFPKLDYIQSAELLEN